MYTSTKIKILKKTYHQKRKVFFFLIKTIKVYFFMDKRKVVITLGTNY